MINLYFGSAVRLNRFFRVSFFLFVSGLVTILCHPPAASPPFPEIAGIFPSGNVAGLHAPVYDARLRVASIANIRSEADDGPKPKAFDDAVSTLEETPVTVDVLANDQPGDAGGDEEEAQDAALDRDAVDLDPGTRGIQRSRATAQGDYSVSNGLVTFSPAVNFVGITSVDYTVDSKGEETSNKATLRVTVNNVNDAPVITGQTPAPLVTSEDQAITVSLSNLVVSDPDNSYPADFTLQVGAGENYTVSGATVTPSANFSGMLSIPVTVNDGTSSSGVFSLKISVTAVNDAPVITGQTPDPVTTGEQQPLTIALANLRVTDVDNSYPDGFSLTVLDGPHYTVSGQTITPEAGFSGVLSAGVRVSDGAASSNVFQLQVSVVANSRPVIKGQTALGMEEDTPVTITLSNVTVEDPDNSYPEDFTMKLYPGEFYTVAGNVLTPAQDFSGTLSVPVTVHDGVGESAPYTLSVVVSPVNDAPVITGQVPLSTPENEPLNLAFSHLAVTDPDDSYPGDFTMSVLSGEHYSVAGQTITPAPGFNGNLSVQVFVSDGTANSNFFNVAIAVTPVNDPPVITGQRELSVQEDQAFVLSLQDLTVSDPDNEYPGTFTMAVQPGAGYSVSGTTVTPALNFSGTLTVAVTVSDGAASSAPFNLQVTVMPVNDAPVITGPVSLSTQEDTPFTIRLDDLTVSDPDNSYPSGFTLLVSPGENYTLSGNTVTPATHFAGTLTVPLQVSDGALNSNLFQLSLQVVAVNDAPVITGQATLTTLEDTPVTIALSHLNVLDVDNAFPSGFSITVYPGANYTASGQTITPGLDFTGTINVNLTVSDGTSNSAPFVFQIQVGDANDPPVITGQTALSTLEETAVQLTLAHLHVKDPDNPYPAGFTLLVSAGLNYSVAGQTVTPAVNFAGVLTVPVRVNDGINNSATFNFQLTVVQVNDPPSFTAVASQKIQENAPAASIAITGISKGPQEDTQQLTFVATSSNTAIVGDPVIRYDGHGTTAQLSYAPKPNASGVVTITIVAIDNGSGIPPNKNSYSSNFQIEVMEVNSAPTVDAISDMTISEDAEQQQVALTGITAGPGESQALSLAVSSPAANFFEVLEVAYTGPATTGQLRLKVRPDVHGTAPVILTITDNGSGVSPHVNTFSRTFKVVVLPVNDAPVFLSAPVTVAAVDELYEYQIRVSDADQETITMTATTKPGWATFAAQGNGMARLSGRPGLADQGTVQVGIQARDAAATVQQEYALLVNARPTAGPLTAVTEEEQVFAFSDGFFQGAYADGNGHPLAAIQVTALPASGILNVGSRAVAAGDTITAPELASLQYLPAADFFGEDHFLWKASDGYHFSTAAARVGISVVPVNDPPVITFQDDTLTYEVNGEPAFLASLVELSDADDDSLASAEVAFHPRTYRPATDELQFQNTARIRGAFDFQAGVLRLTGLAPREEYTQALRSVQYLYRNYSDPLLEPKTVSFTVHDGKNGSMPRDKVIVLQYTFVEFRIPSGFTPNGDQVNDTWIIDRPGGGLEGMEDAIVSVFNKQGVLVFRTRGFDQAWDGTSQGNPLPADTYFFTIDLQLRNKKTYKGIVTILR